MEVTKKYVEYDEDNFKTYSSTYHMLIQAVCSEIDVVGKEIARHYCSKIDTEKGDKPINRWWFEILDKIKEVNRSIRFANAFEVKPWDKFRVVKTVN